MIRIRPGSVADALAIARVRYESWRAGYAGIIPAEIIERVTGRYDAHQEQTVFASRPWRRTLVAEQAPAAGAIRNRPAADPAAAAPAAAAAEAVPPGEIVGYASYGPERGLDRAPRTRRGSQHARENGRAELYALYVAPGWWSTGTGRALMQQVLEETRREGFPRIVVWVLEQNARARRFYERAGFRPQGRSHVLHELGAVTEICYERDITPP